MLSNWRARSEHVYERIHHNDITCSRVPYAILQLKDDQRSGAEPRKINVIMTSDY